MDWKEFLDKIFGCWKNIEGKHKIKKIKLMIIGIVTGFTFYFCIFGQNEKWYKNLFGLQNWSYEKTVAGEKFISDIYIPSASIVVCPQLVVEYQGEVIYLININNFYTKNYTGLKDGRKNDEDIYFFELEVESTQFDKLDNLEEIFSVALAKEFGMDLKEWKSQCQIYDARLALLKFQQKGKNEGTDRYLIIEQGESRLVPKIEMQYRAADAEFDLDSYEEHILPEQNSSLSKYINECADLIKGKK